VLAARVTRLLALCQTQLSSQRHYDFGLRALRTVLNACVRGRGGGGGSEEEEEVGSRAVARAAWESLSPAVVQADEAAFAAAFFNAMQVQSGAWAAGSRQEPLADALVKTSAVLGAVPEDGFLRKAVRGGGTVRGGEGAHSE
jgi:hypothetical protein